MRRLIFALSVSVSLASSAAFATPVNDMAARTELHAIDTLTLSDAQFLTGDGNARATVTTGALRIPRGQGRLPVVVLQHGSNGMGANIEMWSRELNAIGVSTLALDGFTGRGLTDVNVNQALLGRLNFVLDIYRALDVLAKHPRVDPQRVALMGFSRGGQAALYASLKRFHKMWNRSGIEFAGGQSVRHCTIREEPAGLLINASTREPFTYKDPCVEIGPHVGYNAAAAEAAKASVKDILNTVFVMHLMGR